MIQTRKSMLIVAGASLVLATACTDPSTVGGNPNQRTQQGALIGGLAGAGLGMIISDNNTKGAILGGIAGAAVGAAIGYSLDKQAAELQRDIGNEDVAITNTGDRLIVTLPDDILFATDSAVVNSTLRGDLLTVADSLQTYPNSTVQVIGHTDNTGEAYYNQDLSERRANSVADVLMSGGVAFDRIDTFGRGEDHPVATNLTVEGRAQNRRVEIVILPNPT